MKMLKNFYMIRLLVHVKLFNLAHLFLNRFLGVDIVENSRLEKTPLNSENIIGYKYRSVIIII